MKSLTESLLFNLDNSSNDNMCYENYESVSEYEINENYIVEGDPLESAKNWLDVYVPHARKQFIKNVSASGKNIYIDGDLCLKANAPQMPEEEFKIISVSGDFEIRNCKWTDLTCIPEKIGRNLHIYDFKKITDLTGCPNTLKGNLQIYGCVKLSSLSGSPEKISSISIQNCKSLTNLKGISSNIENNLSLMQCGIHDLTGINTSCPNIMIQDCDDLESLDGLDGIKGIKTLQLKNNAHVNGSVQFN